MCLINSTHTTYNNGHKSYRKHGCNISDYETATSYMEPDEAKHHLQSKIVPSMGGAEAGLFQRLRTNFFKDLYNFQKDAF